MKQDALVAALPAASAPWRYRVARAAARVLPPVLASRVTEQIYPFAEGCRDRIRFVARSVTGSVTAWQSDEVHTHHFAMHGYHDWRLLAVARAACSAGGTIVEVGANVGTETIGFADVVGPGGRVYAFEPLPANVETLHTTLPTAVFPQVQIIALALSDSDGMLAFVPPGDERYTGVGYLSEDGAIQVRSARLDRSIPPDEPVQMLMMDVEGAELAVLRGAHATIARCRPVIALEASAAHAARAGSTLPALHTELTTLGYRMRAMRRWGLEPVDLAPTAAPCNWVAVPVERAGLMAHIASRLFWSGALPPWAGLNPLATSSQ